MGYNSKHDFKSVKPRVEKWVAEFREKMKGDRINESINFLDDPKYRFSTELEAVKLEVVRWVGLARPLKFADKKRMMQVLKLVDQKYKQFKCKSGTKIYRGASDKNVFEGLPVSFTKKLSVAQSYADDGNIVEQIVDDSQLSIDVSLVYGHPIGEAEVIVLNDR